MNLSNVTISSNLAGQDGGGFQNQAPVWGSNVTIAYNTAGKDSTGGDGGGFFNRSAVSLINSIVTHNLDSSPDSEAPDCSSEGEGNPYIRTHFNGPNIMGTTTGCVIGGDFSGLSNSDPLLSIPSKNGGEPQGKDGFYIPWTHALGEGSPAVDAGDDNFCPKTDTRGMPRPMGEHCDLGAFEYDPSSASMLTKEAKSLDMQAQGCSAGSGGTSTLLAILLGMIGILALPTACRR
jgi:hypothetical protein